jgi:hypothetical protein
VRFRRRPDAAVNREYFGDAMVEVEENSTRYPLAPDTALQASDRVVAVTEVACSPTGVLSVPSARVGVTAAVAANRPVATTTSVVLAIDLSQSRRAYRTYRTHRTFDLVIGRR